MTKLLFTSLTLMVLSSSAFAGVCQSYADLPNPAFNLEYRPLRNRDFVVRGTSTLTVPGKAMVQNSFAYEATPVDKGNGITEYRWRDPEANTVGLLKIKRDNAKIVLSIIWTNTSDPTSIYELQCDDGP